MDTKRPDVVYEGLDKLEPHWLDKETGTMSIRNLASGSTTPGATAWQQESDTNIFVDVDTSAAGFETTPVYITSLVAPLNHDLALGATCINNATATSLRVYLRFAFADGEGPNSTFARQRRWHINWIGMENGE